MDGEEQGVLASHAHDSRAARHGPCRRYGSDSRRSRLFLLLEIYPQKGRLLGKPGSGAWSRGDAVRLSLDGTSATVFELLPEDELKQHTVFNAAALLSTVPPSAE